MKSNSGISYYLSQIKWDTKMIIYDIIITIFGIKYQICLIHITKLVLRDPVIMSKIKVKAIRIKII